MRFILLFILIVLSSCTDTTDVYETRIVIENDLNSQLNCRFYPKSGIYISCDTISVLSSSGGIEIIYGLGRSNSPEKIITSVLDSLRITYTNPSDTIQHLLFFSPSHVENYNNNPFIKSNSWKRETSIIQRNSKVKLHMEDCTFAIERDSIISAR